MLKLANAYESRVDWNYVPHSEYNGVVETADGYLTTVMPKEDVGEKATAVASLAHLCGDNSMPFLYVSVPYKVCPYEDPDLVGVADFSNQNCDCDGLLASLGAGGVSVCDPKSAWARPSASPTRGPHDHMSPMRKESPMARSPSGV